jgi:beta-lactamase class A
MLRAASEATAMMTALVDRLNGMCDPLPFHVGWYLEDLRTGARADRHGDVVLPSASTRKIAILMAALAEVHAGRLSLDQPVTIDATYQDTTSGVLQHLRPGFTITLRDALVLMIIVSDNTCTGTVADMVGLDRVNALCRAIGMVGTTHRHGTPPKGLPPDHGVEAVNATTPNDVGLLLGLILAGAEEAAAAARLGSTPEHCRLALEILSWQKLRTRLPSLLPEGTKVAHKTGTGSTGRRCFNDAGIVYRGDRPRFILSAYTDRVPGELSDGTPGFAAAAGLIGRMARAAYDALSP